MNLDDVKYDPSDEPLVRALKLLLLVSESEIDALAKDADGKYLHVVDVRLPDAVWDEIRSVRAEYGDVAEFLLGIS